MSTSTEQMLEKKIKGCEIFVKIYEDDMQVETAKNGAFEQLKETWPDLSDLYLQVKKERKELINEVPDMNMVKLWNRYIILNKIASVVGADTLDEENFELSGLFDIEIDTGTGVVYKQEESSRKASPRQA